MIFGEPALEPLDRRVLGLIETQRNQLQLYTQNAPRRWLGSLRRSTFARAIQGSNSIEGYNASIDEAIAAIEDEPPLDERTETWLAIKGYRDALTCIMQAAADPYFEYSRQFLKSLHFMMLSYAMHKSPGQWRPGSVYVVNDLTEQIVYEAPPAELVDGLVEELVTYLTRSSSANVMVRGAMAHLNLAMIHPFRDGNGRMARALQTLVLARDGVVHPIFSSIEEWLGRNTAAYYAILLEVGQGKWNPARDALPWVRFCLKAHYQQAATLLRRNEEYEKLYEEISKIVAREKLDERTAVPLFDAAQGMRLTNARYRSDVEVSEYVAGRDLKELAERGLLEAHGERRGRSYRGGKELRDLREKTRIKRTLLDPYEVAIAAAEPRLPGV